jgi:hypothetical protein
VSGPRRQNAARLASSGSVKDGKRREKLYKKVYSVHTTKKKLKIKENGGRMRLVCYVFLLFLQTPILLCPF